MGNSGSKSGDIDLEAEAEYLSERTGLDREEVVSMHREYSAKNKMSRKEFVKEFKRTFPNVVDPNSIANRVFETCDANNDGFISFREFCVSVYLLTSAPREVKLKKVFTVLDADDSGSLSCQEVVQAVKQAYDVLGRLNQDYNRRGIQVFRAMDRDGDMKVDVTEFVNACLEDDELAGLLESGMGGGQALVGGGGCDNHKDRQ